MSRKKRVTPVPAPVSHKGPLTAMHEENRCYYPVNSCASVATTHAHLPNTILTLTARFSHRTQLSWLQHTRRFASRVLRILPSIEAHAAEVTYGGHETLLPDVDDVRRLQPVREVDAQFAGEGVQWAQSSFSIRRHAVRVRVRSRTPGSWRVYWEYSRGSFDNHPEQKFYKGYLYRILIIFHAVSWKEHHIHTGLMGGKTASPSAPANGEKITPARDTRRSLSHPVAPLLGLPCPLTRCQDDRVYLLVDLRETGAGAQAPETQVGLHGRDRPRSRATPPSPPSRGGRLPRPSFSQHHHLVVIDILHALGQKEPQNRDERGGHAQRTAAQNISPATLAGAVILTLSRARDRGRRPSQDTWGLPGIHDVGTPHCSPSKAKVSKCCCMSVSRP